MSDFRRLLVASFLAGLAVHVAAGGRRPPTDDLQAVDCTDVLRAHGVAVS